MSGSIFKRRRKSSAVSGNPPFMDDESHQSTGDGRSDSPARPSTRTARTTSASAGLPSSYGSRPSRSFIHNAAHGTQEVQYASSGVREETAELSSSFLSDSEMARRFNPDHRQDSESTQPDLRLNGTIEERSEPVSPANEAVSPEVADSQFKPRPSEIMDRIGMEEAVLSSPHSNATRVPDVVITGDDEGEATEITALLPRSRLSSIRHTGGFRQADEEAATTVEDEQSKGPPGTWNRLGHHYPSPRDLVVKARQTIGNPKSWDVREIGRKAVIEPAQMLPAVFLGVLLNLLDALSYGIILFPLGEEVFSDLGPDGVSMFYVSCIISQLTYSTGSIFRGGVGSEMIEVVPFFHKMTYMIMARMGTDNPDALRATVITSYAMSSIITGAVFFVLGSLRLGTLVNFFPHSILTGCIGGVGIFLFLTGIEVSARLPGNFEFTMDVAHQLFNKHAVALWIPPLALAVLLLAIRRWRDPPWLVPAYYIGITAVFYIVTAAVPSITMENLRKNGWVFEAPAAGVPFYNFYSHYKFSMVDWDAIGRTIPSQLALTFFGILHVPINVPNLAMVVQEDNVSINRELLMHGISNTLSGCVGSIQNYLVFVNSVLFMDTGGNSRLAGYMLAAATAGLWIAGPVVIGYVPVMVVGTLIYMLGIDLAQEALFSTYGRLYQLEYFTIVAIALVMGFYDFVVGIAIGIGLACLVYVVQTSRREVVTAEFTGTVAESTVRRHPRQRNYLHQAGRQIRVLKLTGYLFFGSIVRVEKRVRAVIDAESFATEPIRYLVLDFTHVTGIDFSAAEAFKRMNRIVNGRDVTLILANVSFGNEVGKALQMVGLFVEGEVPPPKVFENLNAALESCENDLLKVLQEKQKLGITKGDDSPPIQIQQPHGRGHSISQLENSYGSPRRNFLNHAATAAITETTEPEPPRWRSFKQPLPLLLQAFQDFTDKNEDFWYRAVPYFVKKSFPKGQMIYNRGDRPDGFYLLQSGILRAEYYLDQGQYHESIVAGTTCGELPFFR